MSLELGMLRFPSFGNAAPLYHTSDILYFLFSLVDFLGFTPTCFRERTLQSPAGSTCLLQATHFLPLFDFWSECFFWRKFGLFRCRFFYLFSPRASIYLSSSAHSPPVQSPDPLLTLSCHVSCTRLCSSRKIPALFFPSHGTFDRVGFPHTRGHFSDTKTNPPFPDTSPGTLYPNFDFPSPEPYLVFLVCGGKPCLP